MRQPDSLRLDQIFKTIERTMQFISFVMICQIWKNKRKKVSLKYQLNLVKGISGENCYYLSLGNYSWLIRTLGNLINENKRIVVSA